MTQQVKILKGLPASGKTTYAKEFVENNEGWLRINKDDLRKMMSVPFERKNEWLVNWAKEQIMERALIRGMSVIIDDTNFNPHHETSIRRHVNLLKSEWDLDVQVDVMIFECDVDECIKRDELRPESERVGKEVIIKMWEKYLKKEENPPENQDTSLPPAIICDLDGTLALHRNRSPYDCFNCQDDEVNGPVKECISTYKEKGYNILLVSGRSYGCYGSTSKWLEDNNIEYDLLLMRKSGDMRKDFVIKEELFNEHIKNKYYVHLILDDRNQVVDMWRKKGLKCWQVNYGNF